MYQSKRTNYDFAPTPHSIEIRGINYYEHQSSIAQRLNAKEQNGKLPPRAYAMPGRKGAFTQAQIIDHVTRCENRINGS